MRHDRIRDLEASMLKDICKDVRIEPELLPVGNVVVDSSNTAERARLDQIIKSNQKFFFRTTYTRKVTRNKYLHLQIYIYSLFLILPRHMYMSRDG